MTYVGHVYGHAVSVYCMWNRKTNEYSKTRDIILLNCMSYKGKIDFYEEKLDENEEFWGNPCSTPDERWGDDNLDNLYDNTLVVNGETEDKSWVKYTTRAAV